MKLNRRQAYFSILATTVFICLLYQSVWIFSKTTNAEIRGVENLGRAYKISWLDANYYVGYDAYYGSFLRDGFDLQKRNIQIRYLTFDPNISRSDTFAGNWGPLLMFFILIFIITSIVFIRRDIVSEQALFILNKKRPYIAIQNNVIEDYDQHDIDKSESNNAQQALKLKLQQVEELGSAAEISTSVYKYNPTAIAIIVIYIIYFFWAIPSIFVGHLSYPEIIFFGSILVLVPPYIQNTDNPTCKMKIPNEGSLIFSAQGLNFKGNIFELHSIESAVIYLESFRGFEYRDHVSLGKTNTINDGDNNKLSIRHKGEVSDFIFIINDITDYWSLKKIMSYWSLNGVNVFLEKVFEDDFIIQEQVYFHPD